MIACLYVPLFPLAARLRSEPELKDEAVAVCEGNGSAARVVAATRKARRAGIEPGMTLPQARARVPKLVARGRDRECERAAQEALLEVAEIVLAARRGRGGGGRLSGSGGASRASRLRGGRQEARSALARDILRAAEKALLPARVGVAASKLAARVAAGLPDTPTVVAEGEESRFLAPLPLEKLAPALEIAATLDRWGLRSIGDFAKLPEGEVASRLGESRPRAPRDRARHRPAPARAVPAAAVLLRGHGPRVAARHARAVPLRRARRARAPRRAASSRRPSRARAWKSSLKLDPDGHDARAIALPAPTRDVKTLLTLVRLELEARPPGAPVAGFSFSAHPDSPRRAQLSLFGPAALSPDRLATTIARLAALLGADRVGSPRSIDGHRPERFTDTGYAPPPPPHTRLPPREGRGLLAVRVLRPAVALEVLTVDSVLRDAGLTLSARRAGRGQA